MSGSAKVIGSVDISDLFGDDRITVKPKGYHFVIEISEATGLSYSHTGRKLQQAHAAGKVESVSVFCNGKYKHAYRVNLT